MSVKRVIPEPGEIVGMSVSSTFLLVNDPSSLSRGFLALSAGQLPQGCAFAGFHLGETEYADEMVSAVRKAVRDVNTRWGLDTWDAKKCCFSGRTSQPFLPID